ncbi:MAG: glycoside hydrolase family 127 protein, partial [Phycisphaerae bacterium]|nr:glycoside hydrolase family 127 protein [Phycisphaerae bacterium]
ALWNHRMYLMEGDGRYIDILERVIYNGFLSGVSMTGDRFFYPNPLASDAGYQRSEWFGCSCCPVNVVRFIPSILGYIYGVRDDSVFVNLYVAGSAAIKTKSQTVWLTQTTDYPWNGRVELTVEPQTQAEFSLYLRIPGWAQNRPVPSDLYRYMDSPAPEIGLVVNGKKVALKIEKGFAVIRRDWREGDQVVLELPMPVRRVLAHEKVAEDEGRVALERGPVVFCLEGVDNGGAEGFDAFLLNDEAELKTEFRKDLLNGVQVITGQAQTLRRTKSDSIEARPRAFTAIPYYAWAHRGPSAMAVWLPRTKETAEVEPIPTIASKSKVSVSYKPDMENAQTKSIQDQRLPKNSGDNSFPHFHWWSHKGTTEWIQYDLAERAKVTSCQVYWFDDTGHGECRVPKSWRILYRTGGEWKPVTGVSAYGVAKDALNAVKFDSVETDGLRLEVQLQDGFSGGVYEWVVD